ncbi:hypothetical protein [Streptomyces sp. NPDC048636]|uniref:hypothetical protein n=1 Tax=Streptomyces sp. NPDC048636 TaxID=3155762 RepID=UPI00343751CF
MPDETTPRPGAGLSVTLIDQGLIVQGASRRYVFRGRAAVSVLPRLLHPEDDVLAGTGLSDGQLHRILGMLNARLLVEPPAGPVSENVPDHLRPYSSRPRDAGGGYPGVAALLDTLADSAAGILGASEAGQRIADELRGSGVGQVHRAARALDPDQTELVRDAARRLVICVDGPHDPGHPHEDDLLADAVARCGQGEFPQIPVVRLAASPGHLEVGPVFFPGYTGCVDCFRRGREAAGWGAPAPTAPVADAMAALAGGEALAFLLRTTAMRAPRTVTRIPLDGGSSESFLVAPESDCPDCPPRPAVLAVGDDAQTGA